MSHPIDTDVLIIGAGPTGMVSALCLAMHGVSSIVVERQPGLHTHPKAHELSGRSLEILTGLGVPFEALAREASPEADASRILFCDGIDREFGCIDLKAMPDADKYRTHVGAPAGYLNVSQVEVERVLVERVRECQEITLRYNHQWERLEQDGDGVISEVTDRQSGETVSIRSRYVVCVDGAGSRSRQALGIDMIGPEKLQDVVSAYFEADLTDVVTTRGKLYFMFNPDAPGALIAHHIERRWVFHAIVATPHEKVEDFGLEVMQAKIRLALRRPDLEITIRSMSPWRMTAQVASRFRAGRAFLAGDAAHRFPPTGGLGMNSGIGDAHNLAWKLAMVLQGRAPDSLLDTYEPERRPVVQRNCDESLGNSQRMSEILLAFGLDPAAMGEVARRMNSAPITALPEWGQAWIRRQLNRYGSNALARFHRDPEVRERVLAAVARQQSHFDRIGLDLGYCYSDGAVLDDGSPPPAATESISEYVPSTRPGARFPHFWLDGNARRRSSHTLVDYRHSTLVLGAACPVRPDEIESLQAAAKHLGVRVVSLGDGVVPPACRGPVHMRCQIGLDGGLMIRPDGHVSWRQGSGVVPDLALVESILEQTCGKK